MQEVGVKYMQVGYGHSFKEWLRSDNPQPYNSLGNGSAMRVAAAGLFGLSLSDCQKIARLTAEVSHNHPEGIKGAEAVASAIRLAKSHRTKDTIKEYIETKYGYDLSRSLDDIRENYGFDPTCQGSVPEAIICFLESTDMESAIRLAVSLGGDADTWREILPEDFFDTIGTFIKKNNDLAKTFCERPVLDEKELISTLLKN